MLLIGIIAFAAGTAILFFADAPRRTKDRNALAGLALQLVGAGLALWAVAA